MMIDQEKIMHVATLARLKITLEEAAEYQQQLSQVLSHFEQLSKVNTEGIEPLVTPVEIEFFAREDVLKSDFSAEQMLENAPDRAGNLFKVPPVVGI